ncbi:hypothetical protein PMAC_000914 [Pneumocystis sp. 'macacae']|nr:hypothetical protein PMAC_000914 [Pneumocystis sp. 'macacae']
MKHRILLSTESYARILEFSRSKETLSNYFFNPEIRLKISFPFIFAISHSLDGRFIAIAADFIYLYDLKNPGKLLLIPGTKNTKHLVFGGNSDEIFFVKEKLTTIMNYHIKSKKIVTLSTQKRHPSPIRYIAISKDSRFILTVSENPSIIFLQDCMTHLTDKIVLGASFGNVKSAVFHPKKSNIFLLCFTNGIGFYDAKKLTHPIFRVKDVFITSALFLPNEESSALSIDLNGQFSIIDFEKKEIQMKWSINAPGGSLSIKELECGGWNIFVLASHEKCFYFNQEGVKLSEYSIDSERILQISTLENDIPINDDFLDIVIEDSNSNISKFLISEDLHGCFFDEKIQPLINDKISDLISSTNNSLKTKIDKTQLDFEKRLCVNKNNLSVVSLGKENIPIEDPFKNNFIMNTPTKESSTSYVNKSNVFSPSKVYEIQSTFKFETPKTSKKKTNLSIKFSSNESSFQKNQLILEKSPKKYLTKLETPNTSDIWCKLGTDQTVDAECPFLNNSPVGENIQTHEAKKPIKNTLSIFANFSKFQNFDSSSIDKELLEFDPKSLSTDMLMFKDMLFEVQKVYVTKTGI